MSQGRGLVCYWYVHVTNVGVDVAGTKEHPQKQTAGNWKDPQKERINIYKAPSLVFQLFVLGCLHQVV